MSGSQIEAKSVTVFYSYAQDDQNLLTELDERLIMLKREGLITVWSAQRMKPGQDQAHEIRAHLEAAQIILLLISASYLANDECYAQLQRAEERAQTDGIAVVPVLARPASDLKKTPIAGRRTLPTGGRPITSWTSRDQAYSDVADGIRLIAESLQTVQQSEQLSLRSLSAPPILLDSRAIYPRANLVQETYQKLLRSDTSALVLTGMGGIGKSTAASLVFQYAEEQRIAGAGPFTGQALRFEIKPTATLLDLLKAVSLALGKNVLHSTHLTAQDQATELFNILYQCDTPCLILLDQFDVWLDARTGAVRPEQVGVDEWLDRINSQVGSCRLLLTSRIWPQGARTYRPICMQEVRVDGLHRDEGVALLRQWGMQDDDTDLALAVERCKGLPQALVLLDKVQRSNHLPLATLLNDSDFRQLWIEDVGRNLFDYIYGQQLDSNQRNLLFALAIYRTPVSRQAIQAVIQEKLSPEQLTAALNVLQDLDLLRYTARDGSYELHALIAEFARQHFLSDVEQTMTNTLRDAHSRAAQYYLRQFSLMRQPRIRQSVEDVQYLIEASWHYCQAGQQQVAYDLILKEHIFTDLQRWGRNAVLLELYLSLLPSASWQPEPKKAGRIYNEIGDIYSDLGRKDTAQQYYDQALALFRQSGLRQGEVKSLLNLGTIYRSYGQIEQALTCYQDAKRISDESEEELPEKGILLHNIGKAYYSLGRQERKKSVGNDHYALALEYYEQALVVHEQTNNSSEEARTRNNIGEVYAAMKQGEEAWKYYEEALDLFLELGERRGQGIVYNNLGALDREAWEKQAAFEYYTQALAIFREIGDRWEEVTVLRNLGRLFALVNRFDAALACLWLASSIADTIHKNIDGEIVPLWIRRSLPEDEFEQLWLRAESQASRIIDQAIREGLPPDEDEKTQ